MLTQKCFKIRVRKGCDMEWTFQFAYPYILYSLFPFVVLAAWYRYYRYKVPVYRYSMTSLLTEHGMTVQTPRRMILSMIRFIVLVGLILLIARPQLVDEKSKVHVEGIDIMLVLDVSGSMSWFDDPQDQRPRIDIAKEEAINFIRKRDNDPIGIVMFGVEAVSRCPLTLDKKMLESIVSDTVLGVINPNGTVLSQGVVTAVNRLRKSEAKTKIIILLTDGSPGPEDINPLYAIEAAKKYEIKVYTIGVGGKYGGLQKDGFGNIIPMGVSVNKQLLETLASQTGGKYFEAANQKDLHSIYSIIDSLEKTEYETNVYQNYRDFFQPFLWAFCILLFVGVLLATFVWFGL